MPRTQTKTPSRPATASFLTGLNADGKRALALIDQDAWRALEDTLRPRLPAEAWRQVRSEMKRYLEQLGGILAEHDEYGDSFSEGDLAEINQMLLDRFALLNDLGAALLKGP